MRQDDERDVLDYLYAELSRARAQAAQWVGRCESLRELCALADGAAAQLNSTVLTPSQLSRSVSSEEERARLSALIDRALPENNNTPQEPSND